MGGAGQRDPGPVRAIVGASSEEIAFVKNTSEGLSFVAAGFPWKEGDNLVTANVEYPSNVYPWLRLRTRNVEVRMIPRGRAGCARKISSTPATGRPA